MNYSEMQQIARSKMPETRIARIFFVQALTEAKVKLRDRLAFRTRENRQAAEAYRQMKIEDFEWVNSRQMWANWRTIPRNLSACGFQGPVRAIDLCCGVGHSTEVLACFLPENSSLLGLEYSPDFVAKARARSFSHHSGKSARVEFRAQSVLETFLDEDGKPVASDSIDLVNSSGAVGCHFDPASTEILAREVHRVLKRGGFAFIDAGEAGTPRPELIRIFESLGMAHDGEVKSCFLDRYTNVRFVKA